MALTSKKGAETGRGSVYGSVGWGEEEGSTDYGSLLHQLREAEDEAQGLLHFLSRCQELCWDSLAVTAVLVLLLCMPIAMLAVGTSYQHECPQEPRVPIYLQVGGAFGCLLLLLLLYQHRRWRRAKDLDDDIGNNDDDDDDDGVMTRSCRFTCHVVSLFLLAWFVMGNVWLWAMGQPNFKQPLHEPRNWCSKVLYLFTLYHLLACHGLLAVSLVGILLTVLVYSVRHNICCWCCLLG
ncbi:transmembrane protein 272-like [Babylonia areolata]|uniref:transmembrane protein 272-like n=1 Tax=Babylonia areolata TaxID=304850 RepID=UPI003FD434F7